MSFVNNTKEPQKSKISQKFVPIYEDKSEYNIFKFNTSNHRFQKFVLEENGHYLEGRINGIL